MNNKTFLLALALIAVISLPFLPVFPLLVEGREFSQAGESLYQEWRLVSVREYYGYAQYAQSAWLDSTKIAYTLLALIYSFILASSFVLIVRGLVRGLKAKRGEV
ncbi:MAG TPA: hypothetical protein PKE62_02535 [Anaerolineales bacterium]|nr:hypothetical protein [Anaerolineales bacterium]